MKEPGFWLGNMPTQTVTKPFTYEKWEHHEPVPLSVPPLQDVAAMGRVWYLKQPHVVAWARDSGSWIRSAKSAWRQKPTVIGASGTILSRMARYRLRVPRSTASTRPSSCEWSLKTRRSSADKLSQGEGSNPCQPTTFPPGYGLRSGRGDDHLPAAFKVVWSFPVRRQDRLEAWLRLVACAFHTA